MASNELANKLAINGDRLWQSLMELAQIGATEKGGNCRLALTALDGAGRDLVVGWMKQAGLTIRVDQVGNIFGRRAGRDDTLAPVMMGSGVFAGKFTLDTALDAKDLAGLSVRDELQAIGYAGADAVGDRPIGAYFEAHIEQGPILEHEDKVIGVVTGSLGVRWYDVTVTGMHFHAGPTPMAIRKDALFAATHLMQEVIHLANDNQPHGRGTVGAVQIHPGSRNVIPGQVTFTADIRHQDEATLDRMDQRWRQACIDAQEKFGLKVQLTDVQYFKPTPFDPALVDAIRAGAASAGLSHMDIVTGAGHDAVYIASVAPTAMIFVPCKDGISHNEIEDAKPEHLEAGGNVLLAAMLARAGRIE